MSFPSGAQITGHFSDRPDYSNRSLTLGPPSSSNTILHFSMERLRRQGELCLDSCPSALRTLFRSRHYSAADPMGL